MRQNNLSIHSENILPIIKKWLYSDKDIFLRELVSNATDALNKIRILQGEGAQELEISVEVDKKNRTIAISDTGIGMTEEEVEKYIAQIAFSGAEEFVSKYKSQTEKDPIIGHFGLGFYSAYMVAAKVEIETLSYTEGAKPVFWSCDGSSAYTIGAGSRKERGTQITLHLDEASQEYLDEAKILSLLQRYCLFLPFPITLGKKPLGNKAPLWMKAPSECTEKEYLDFHHQLFPTDPEPLFWIHLNVDYPFNLKGILYFPKIHRRFDASDSTIKLFCNRVFVSPNCKDILPDYLCILRGAIDSPDIPLNVSRSYLQIDQSVRQLSSHISKKISDRLTSLYKTEEEKYTSSWEDIELFVKLGVLQDEKFYDRMKEALIWKNSEGAWTSAAAYLERAQEKKIYYSAAAASPLLKLYKEKKIEVLIASAPIDSAVIQFLEDKLSTTFQRIDGSLTPDLVDASREKTLLDAEGKSESARIADFVRSSLSLPNVEIEAKSLSSDELPALLLIDERERRLREYVALTAGKMGKGFEPKKTFVVNTNSKLIQATLRLAKKQPDAAAGLVQGIYDLSQLGQKEVAAEEIEPLIARQTEILETLASLV
jgi:molecular chaperone HtpG